MHLCALPCSSVALPPPPPFIAAVHTYPLVFAYIRTAMCAKVQMLSMLCCWHLWALFVIWSFSALCARCAPSKTLCERVSASTWSDLSSAHIGVSLLLNRMMLRQSVRSIYSGCYFIVVNVGDLSDFSYTCSRR